MRIKNWYILLGLITVLQLMACTKGNVGPCDGGGPNKLRVELGSVYLSPEFRKWINPSRWLLIFKNSNGGRYEFQVSKTFVEMYDETLRLNPRPCGDDEDYCKIERDHVSYSSADVPFTIKLFRDIPIDDYDDFQHYDDSTNTISERLSFSLDINGFDFMVSDTTVSFAGSYTLLDSVYYDVCICENPKAQSGLYPVKFILQRGRGLIGFELSNKEVWAWREE